MSINVKRRWTALAVAVAMLCGVTVAAPSPAQAAMRDYFTRCSEGPNGRACIHIETDSATGRIRARAAVHSFSGIKISILWVELDRYIDSTDGNDQSIFGIAVDGPTVVATTGAPVSDHTGSVVELCDGIASNGAVFVTSWRASMGYYVGQSPNGRYYYLETGYRYGTC